MCRKRRPAVQQKGQYMINERKFHHQIVRRTVKASRIQLIGFRMIQRQMPIRVMSNKGVNSELGSNAQRKHREQHSCQKGSYGVESNQAVFATRLHTQPGCKLWDYFRNRKYKIKPIVTINTWITAQNIVLPSRTVLPAQSIK